MCLLMPKLRHQLHLDTKGIVDFSVMENTLTYALPRGLHISNWFKAIVLQDLPTSGSALLAYHQESRLFGELVARLRP